MKFCPQHFPNGTVFKLKDAMLRFQAIDEHNPQYTVRCIVRNGAESYVLCTGVMRTHTGEMAFNIEHVEKIIKRGSGPVQIEQGYFGIGNYKNAIDDMNRMSYRQPKENWVPKKGYHNTGAIHTVLHLELCRLPEALGMNIDFTRLANSVLAQSWVKKPKFGCAGIPVFCLNKKRLRKYVKANLNRFLKPLRASTREYNELVTYDGLSL